MKWIAHFSDNTVIRQFSEDNPNERLFQEVLDRIGDLELFNMMDEKGNCFIADIKNAELRLNDVVVKELDKNKIYSLIYFNRVTLQLGTEKSNTETHIGLKSDDIEHKIIINQDQKLVNVI